MADSIYVNGNELSYGSLVLKCEGERYFGFSSITWGHKRTRTKKNGMDRSGAPRARSRGTYTIDEIKLKGPVDTVKKLRAQLRALGPNGVSYGDTEFQIDLTGQEQEQDFSIQYQRCTYAGETGTFEDGENGLEEEITIDCMRIVRDGGTLFESEPT